LTNEGVTKSFEFFSIKNVPNCVRHAFIVAKCDQNRTIIFVIYKKERIYKSNNSILPQLSFFQFFQKIANKKDSQIFTLKLDQITDAFKN